MARARENDMSRQMEGVENTLSHPAKIQAANSAERTLVRLLHDLQREQIPFWVMDGFGDGAFDPVDVDILVPRAVLPSRIGTVIQQSCQRNGATMISWDRDHQFVVACPADAADHSPIAPAAAFLRIHLRPDYRRVGRYFYDGAAVLAAQPTRAGDDAEAHATPLSPREFACYLIEKIVKCSLTPAHERTLTKAFAKDPDGAAAEIRRFWSAASASLIEAAARSGNWEVVRRAQGDLRRELRRGAFVRRPFWTVGYKFSKGIRRVVEYIRPSTGLHVVMLGPDGVGKSTVVEVLQRDLAPAFCGIEYGTFAPALLPHKPPPDGGGQPHAKPPRSLPASIIKALWWIVYYSLGYHFTTRPILGRGGLALNHRYCVDAIVDRRRYRYNGPDWLLTLAWRLARKPDLVFLLDAPPEVVQARKKEVAFEETVRQRDAYRKLVEPMVNGHVIDSTQPVADVAGDVERVIVHFMAERTARRLGLEQSASAAAKSRTRKPVIEVGVAAAAAASVVVKHAADESTKAESHVEIAS
jgi:thymidylate kinase